MRLDTLLGDEGFFKVSSCHISPRNHYADSLIPSFVILTEEGSSRLDMRSATTDLHHHWSFRNSIPQPCLGSREHCQAARRQGKDEMTVADYGTQTIRLLRLAAVSEPSAIRSPRLIPFQLESLHTDLGIAGAAMRRHVAS
jgi:hypothetical protein